MPPERAFTISSTASARSAGVSGRTSPAVRQISAKIHLPPGPGWPWAIRHLNLIMCSQFDFLKPTHRMLLSGMRHVPLFRCGSKRGASHNLFNGLALTLAHARNLPLRFCFTKIALRHHDVHRNWRTLAVSVNDPLWMVYGWMVKAHKAILQWQD